MITITNQKEKIVLSDEELRKIGNNYFFYKGNIDTDWEIEIEFYKEDDNITKIIKRFGSADGYSGDILSEYPNQIESIDKVVLSINDFDEIKRLLGKLRKGDIYKRKTVVNAYAQLLAYEVYIDLIIYELDKINVESIFVDIFDRGYFMAYRPIFKEDIYKRTKEILRKEYKVDLDYVFDGGKEE